MSANFLRVKEDILRDIRETTCHTQDSWADILLKHSQYCVTKEDQQSLYNFILNPSNSREFVEPKYVDIPIVNSVDINRFEKMVVNDPDEEKETETEINLKNEIYTRGGTSFIITKPVRREECTLESQTLSQEC